MSKWQSFLTSLSTPGGNIIILCFFSGILLAMVMVAYKSGDTQRSTFVYATASTFLGALVGILRGRSSDPVGGSTATTSTTSTVSTSPELPKP